MVLCASGAPKKEMLLAKLVRLARTISYQRSAKWLARSGAPSKGPVANDHRSYGDFLQAVVSLVPCRFLVPLLIGPVSLC
jgi:hypothetical protein